MSIYGADEPKEKPQEIQNCTYTREYITSLEYFRAHKEFELPDNESKVLAWKISRGCTGAAHRFIKITSTLSRAGVGMRNSVNAGLELASRTDTETATFLTVFTKAFLAEYLDLDLKTSLDLAYSLATKFKGDIQSVRKDFDRFVGFCIDVQELNLPVPQCAAFAAKLAQQGEPFYNGIADPFIKTYTFLRSEKGPHLTTWQSLKLAEGIMAGGPEAADNFIQAFKYAVSKEGLGNGIPEAIQFGQKMATPKKKSRTG